MAEVTRVSVPSTSLQLGGCIPDTREADEVTGAWTVAEWFTLPGVLGVPVTELASLVQQVTDRVVSAQSSTPITGGAANAAGGEA